MALFLVRQKMACPCGGGQSCIVDRRFMKAWVHEDDVLAAAGLPARRHCHAPFNESQSASLLKWLEERGFPDSIGRKDDDVGGDASTESRSD